MPFCHVNLLPTTQNVICSYVCVTQQTEICNASLHVPPTPHSAVIYTVTDASPCNLSAYVRTYHQHHTSSSCRKVLNPTLRIVDKYGMRPKLSNVFCWASDSAYTTTLSTVNLTTGTLLQLLIHGRECLRPIGALTLKGKAQTHPVVAKEGICKIASTTPFVTVTHNSQDVSGVLFHTDRGVYKLINK